MDPDKVSKENMFYVFRSVGITMLVLSLSIMVSSIADFTTCCLHYPAASGIWCSPFVVVTGIMLILLSKFNSSCMASWTGIFVVLSELFLVCLLVIQVYAIFDTVDSPNPARAVIHGITFCLALAQFTLCTYLLVLFMRTCCSATSNLSFYDAFAQCCQNGAYMKLPQQQQQQPLMLYGFPPSTPHAAQLQA